MICSIDHNITYTSMRVLIYSPVTNGQMPNLWKCPLRTRWGNATVWFSQLILFLIAEIPILFAHNLMRTRCQWHKFFPIIAVCILVCARPPFDNKAIFRPRFLAHLATFLNEISCILLAGISTLIPYYSFPAVLSSCAMHLRPCWHPRAFHPPCSAKKKVCPKSPRWDEPNGTLFWAPNVDPAPFAQNCCSHSGSIWPLNCNLQMDLDSNRHTKSNSGEILTHPLHPVTTILALLPFGVFGIWTLIPLVSDYLNTHRS